MIKLLSYDDIFENQEFKELLKETFVLSGYVVSEQFIDSKIEALYAYYNSENKPIIIGYFEKNDLIGFLWAYEFCFLSEFRIHINHVCVEQTFRSQGVFSKMFDYLKDYALKKGILKLEISVSASNKRVKNIYDHKGFIDERTIMSLDMDSER